MSENSAPGNAAGMPKDAATAKNGEAPQPAASVRAARLSPGSISTNALSIKPAQQATVKCPKCGATVREIARFCQRCHNTMRYECPACGHQQRTGGNCEKCGINFIKYVTAVVAAKQVEADAIRDKIEQRSTLIKNLLFIPFTGGISLIRQLLVGRNRKS